METVSKFLDTAEAGPWRKSRACLSWVRFHSLPRFAKAAMPVFPSSFPLRPVLPRRDSSKSPNNCAEHSIPDKKSKAETNYFDVLRRNCDSRNREFCDDRLARTGLGCLRI